MALTKEDLEALEIAVGVEGFSARRIDEQQQIMNKIDTLQNTPGFINFDSDLKVFLVPS